MRRAWTIWSFYATRFYKVSRRLKDPDCAVAAALQLLGDGWTLLLIREAFLGTRRFADFEAELGIAKNVLAQRLAHLCEGGALARVDAGQHGVRYEYELTPMGKDLATVMTALRQWSDRWLIGAGREPLLVHDRRTGRPIPPLRIRGEDGAALHARDLEVRPGPGASPRLLARMRRAAEATVAASRRPGGRSD
jgi:DNA-binding HxlR family transcriptional regulator